MLRNKKRTKKVSKQKASLRRNPRFSRYKESLKAAALKFEDFEAFVEAYLNAASRGTYWVGTDDADIIDEAGLEKELKKKGSLIAYINPFYIDQPFAIEINAARLDPEDFKKNLKEPKYSIKITRPDLVYVNYIYPREKAQNVWLYNARHLPNSYKQLKEFWEETQKDPEVTIKPIAHIKRKKT